jgi:hypothetical protein
MVLVLTNNYAIKFFNTKYYYIIKEYFMILIKAKLKRYIKLIFIIIAITSGFVFGEYIYENKYNHNTNIISTNFNFNTGMTLKQRTEDFDKMCKYIENNVPMLYEYEKLYNIRYDDIKKYYKQLIENSNSDYEYYAYLQGFFNNIPSGHMSIGYPNMDYIDFVDKYLISDNTTFVNVQSYWENVLHQECSKHFKDNENTMLFVYSKGEYIGSSGDYENDTYNINNAKLLSVNDVEVNEFIKIYPSLYKLKYDHVNKKPFRDIFLFNDKFGLECEVKYQVSDGTVKTTTLYYSTIADVALSYMEYFKACDNGTVNEFLKSRTNDSDEDENIDYMSNELSMGSVSAIRDKGRRTLYLRINSFEADSRCAVDIIKKSASDLDNIIIDIRANRGGYAQIADEVLAELTLTNININDCVYITKSKYKESHYNDTDINKKSDIKDLYSMTKSSLITHKASEKKNIYLLISDETLSAADRFASEFKKNNIGTVLGLNNTQGERYGSPDLHILDYSGIYFYYTEFKYINPDGTDNSVYGTAPDSYVEVDYEHFRIKQNLILTGQDAYTYENRLKWDDVLIKTLEIIKEKENAE